MREGSVAVAYLHPGDVSHSFMQSVLGWVAFDAAHSRRMVGFIIEECGASRVVDGRNSAVRRFLTTDAEWLVFIDADMGFDPPAVEELVQLADPDGRPIVGGLCFGQKRQGSGPANSRVTVPVPTIYRWVDTDTQAGFEPVYDYPRDTMVRCDATGGAFFAVHRKVLVELARRFPEPRPWFDETIYAGQVFSEDLTFFRRCTEAGFDVHVHTGIKTSHYKSVYYEESLLTQDALTVDNYVVVPVKDRLDLTRQLIDKIVGQGECDGIILCDNGSTDGTAEWADTVELVHRLDMPDANIHQMWNAGIEFALARSPRCNVAILNNDIKVGPAFLSTLAGALRADPLAAVVSPNYDGRDLDGPQPVVDICAGRYDGSGGIAGFAFMLRGESGYRFPEQLTWWYGDNDLMMTAAQAGMHGLLVGGTWCEHVDGGGQTGDWDDPDVRAVLDRDGELFREKWAA